MRGKLHTTPAKCKICGSDGKTVASRKDAPILGYSRNRREKVSSWGISCSGTSTATCSPPELERYRAQRDAVPARVRRRAGAPTDASWHTARAPPDVGFFQTGSRKTRAATGVAARQFPVTHILLFPAYSRRFSTFNARRAAGEYSDRPRSTHTACSSNASTPASRRRSFSAEIRRHQVRRLGRLKERAARRNQYRRRSSLDQGGNMPEWYDKQRQNHLTARAAVLDAAR